jgi:glyoxylase-like metal-dependent hydrolase (beta-lactamase superfamily II)
MTTETYTFQLGNFECVAIRDFSRSRVPGNLVPDAPADQLAQAARELDLDPQEIAFDNNGLLVRTGEQNVLFDAGWGTRSEPNRGKLLEGLQAIGLEPGNVDLLAITHGDRDHISGILDEEQQPVFPNARYVLWQGAWDYWTSTEPIAGRPLEGVAFTGSTYTSIEDKLERLPADAEFLPGFQLIAAVGHRRDHVVYRITSRGKQLLHLGDAAIHPLVMAHRDWTSSFDSDPARAAEVKQRWLDWAAAQGALLFGTHFPYPGVGRVRQRGEGWQWLPM